MNPATPPTSDALILGAAVLLFWVLVRLSGSHVVPRLRAATVLLGASVVSSLIATRWQSPLGVRGLESLLCALSVTAAGGFLWSLRPTLLRSLGRGKALPVVDVLALVFGIYVLLLPWVSAHRSPDGDEPWYLLLSHSIAFDADVDLENNYENAHSLEFMGRTLEPQPGDPVGPNGEAYSRHSALLSIVLAVPYRLAGLTGVLLTMCALTALLSWLLLGHLNATFGRASSRGVLNSWLVFSFTAPLLVFAHQVWVEVPAALLTLVAVIALEGLDGRRRVSRKACWWLLGTALVLLPWLKLRFGAIALSLALVALLDGRRRGQLRLATVAPAIGVALVLGGLLVANQLRFGNPLRLYQVTDLVSWGALTLDSVQRFLGLFWDVAFGLFPASPLWLLIVVGLTHRTCRPFRLAVIALPYLAAVAVRQEWYGGWSPAFRYGVVLLPLLACGLVEPLRDRQKHRRLVASLLVAPTLVLTIVWVTLPGWTYNVANGGSHLIQHVILVSGVDLWNVFPSASRSRPAMWLWPILSVAVLWMVWRWKPPRTEPALGRAKLAAVALAASIALLLASLLARQRLPTTHVELESPAVTKLGGSPEPTKWQVNRTQYPEAWVLPEGAEAHVPLVGGGTTVEISVLGRFIQNRSSGPAILEIWCGERRLGEVAFSEPEVWRTLSVRVADWRDGEQLVLRVRAPESSAPANVVNGLAIDHARFRWL